MACPCCSHTMQNLGSPERRIFWCQRCGTLKEYTGEFSRIEMPLRLQQIIRAAELLPVSPNSAQHTSVEVMFVIDQHNDEHPHVRMLTPHWKACLCQTSM